MAWIESHQKLKDDPKMLNLCFSMGWGVDETIGKLHRFWWWCVDHAEDGDLRRFNDGHIAHAMCVDVAQASVLLNAMVETGFVEREPYFRVKNWWKYFRRFLWVKYGDSPEKLKAIQKAYSTDTVTDTVTGSEKVQPNQPTNLTNQKIYSPSCRAALHFLNQCTNSKFRETDTNLKFISARLDEDGVTIEGVRQMIERQSKQWLGTDMEKYLRPETLFNKTKFDSYYAQREKPVTKGKDHGNRKPDHNGGF